MLWLTCLKEGMRRIRRTGKTGPGAGIVAANLIGEGFEFC